MITSRFSDLLVQMFEEEQKHGMKSCYGNCFGQAPTSPRSLIQAWSPKQELLEKSAELEIRSTTCFSI